MASPDLERFQALIGFPFRDRNLIEAALTHRSFVNEFVGMNLPDNQRLEFLGDAIIDFIVAEWLYWRYPDAREGELTSLRADIVRTEGLAAFATEIDLGRHLRLGRGEASTGGHLRPANLCAGFEALIGGMYLDQGLDSVRAWTYRFLEAHAQEIDAKRTIKDAKSLLQEQTQALLRLTPSYRIVREEGPDHAKTFTAQAIVGDEVWGEGAGASKQAAEQAAAANALLRR
ncbi:MAG: ribonuclease III [Anaerolineae bacterium]